MRLTFVALSIAVLAFVAAPEGNLVAHASPAGVAPSKHKKCHPYRGKCQRLAAGNFVVQVANSSITLRGTGTPRTAGTAIALDRVSVLGLRRGEEAFKVFASGAIPPLRLVRKGTLYWLDVATNAWHRIAAVTGPGIYKVAFG